MQSLEGILARPFPEYVPVGQSWQSSPKEENLPAGQSAQVLEPAADDFPAGQSKQEGNLASTYLPAGHSVQSSAAPELGLGVKASVYGVRNGQAALVGSDYRVSV